MQYDVLVSCTAKGLYCPEVTPISLVFITAPAQLYFQAHLVHSAPTGACEFTERLQKVGGLTGDNI